MGPDVIQNVMEVGRTLNVTACCPPAGLLIIADHCLFSSILSYIHFQWLPPASLRGVLWVIRCVNYALGGAPTDFET